MLKRTLIALLASIPAFAGAQALPSYAEVPANCKSAVLWSYPAFYLRGEYLYWTAREDGLKFALSGGNSAFSYAVCQQGSLFDLNWNFHSGFKAGAGLLFDCSGWDLSALYTQFNSGTNRCVMNNQLGTNLLPYWAVFDPDLFILDQAQANWSSKINVLDLDIANEFFINDWFSLRPHFGAKGVWDRQNYRVEYFGYLFNDYNIAQQQRVWGAGPRVGLDVASHFGWCTAIFGDVSFSGLWSRYENCRFDCMNSYANQILVRHMRHPRHRHHRHHHHRACNQCNECDTCNNNSCNQCNNGCNQCNNTPCNQGNCGYGYNNCGYMVKAFSAQGVDRNLLCILEATVGLRWEIPVCGGCYILRGLVAWEAQYWFDHNHFITLAPDTQRSLGSLSLQGLRVGGSIDF